MSLPAAQFALGQAAPTLGVFDAALNMINTSPYIIGSMMLMMNLGARFLSLEITKGQEQFLSHPWVRRFLIFVVFFIGTRNVWVAFWMALIVILLIGYLFNENSSLCLFRGGLPGSACTHGNRQIAEGFSLAKQASSLWAAPQHEGFHAEDGDTTHMAAEGGHGPKPNPAAATQSQSQGPASSGLGMQGLTAEEQEILQKLLAKQQKLVAPMPRVAAPTPPPNLYEIYQRNIDKVKSLF
jgi:hypothetical protein